MPQKTHFSRVAFIGWRMLVGWRMWITEDFLLLFRCNVFILCRFWDTAIYLLKMADFVDPACIWRPFWLNSLEFYLDLLRQKTDWSQNECVTDGWTLMSQGTLHNYAILTSDNRVIYYPNRHALTCSISLWAGSAVCCTYIIRMSCASVLQLYALLVSHETALPTL